MKLTGYVASLNGAARLPRMLPDLVRLCDEVIVLVDLRSEDGTADVARQFTSSVFPFEHDVVLWRNFREEAFRRAGGDWLLMIDDDETLGGSWTRERLDALMNDRRITHYYFPFRWRVPPGDCYIINGAWYPMWQYARLYRNMPTLVRWGVGSHRPYDIAGESAQIADMPIDHWNFVVKTEREREERLAVYRQSQPDDPGTDIYRYQDSYYETEICFDPLPGALEWPTSGEASPSPHCVDIGITHMRKRLTAGEVYTARIEIANRTTRTFAARSRYVDETTPFFVTYHWLQGTSESPTVMEFAPSQAVMPATLRPMTTRPYLVMVWAPTRPGRYLLQFDMVEQNVAWFSMSAGHGFHEVVEIEVVDRPVGAPPPLTLSGAKVTR